MGVKKFGPYIGLIQIFAFVISFVVSIAFIPVLFFTLTSSGRNFETGLIMSVLVLPFLFVIASVLRECKTYILDDDGIRKVKFLIRSEKKIFYRDIISVESKVFEYPSDWFYYKDFKITIKYRSGKLDIFIPGGRYLVYYNTLIPGIAKPNDHAEFMKILEDKIGKGKIKES